MKRKIFAFAAIGSWLIQAGPARAVTTLGFDEIAPGLHASIDSQGFSVAGDSGFFISDDQPTFCSPECPFNGTPYLLTQGGENPIVLSSDTAFDLFSFQYAEQHVGTFFHAASVEVTGTLATGGSVFASFTIDGVNDGSGPLDDFQYAILPESFRNLDSVSFLGADGAAPNADRFSLENLVVVPVPEPSAALLVAGGLLVLSLRGRRSAPKTP